MKNSIMWYLLGVLIGLYFFILYLSFSNTIVSNALFTYFFYGIPALIVAVLIFELFVYVLRKAREAEKAELKLKFKDFKDDDKKK